MKQDKSGTILDAQCTFSPFSLTHLFSRAEDGTVYLDRPKAIAEVLCRQKIAEEVATVRFIRVLIHQFGGVREVFTNSNLTYYLEISGNRIFGGVYNPITKEKETHHPVIGCLEHNTRGCKWRCVAEAYQLLEQTITKLTNNSIESAES